jgi:serine/threonine protein kinase
MARRSLRRFHDPQGRTAPPGVRLQKAEDLYAFLPSRLPHFKEGDRPLPHMRWELVELLGIGGFGEVWKARHYESPGIRVALKFCTDTQAAKLLRHEAKVLDLVMQKGKHDGIVELRQRYLDSDPPCLEYELIEGGELAAWISEQHRTKGRIDPELATKVMRRLAQIMAFAHQPTPTCIVHRDLKPANILVSRTAEGKVSFKIADFGIGNVAAGQSIGQYTRHGTNPAELMTSALHGAFTPLYAPDQQKHGYPPDPRDDVFARGVIWSQILTGRLDKGAPYGKSREKLRELGLTDAALSVMDACIEPDADHRLENAIVLTQELTKLLSGGLRPTPPAQQSVQPNPQLRPVPPTVPGSVPHVGLRVKPEEALRLLATIPHEKCQSAIRNNWKVVDGQVTRQSVAWLFCWGETGQGSRDAAAVARHVFNQLFDMTFDEYRSQVGLEKARRIRYGG